MARGDFLHGKVEMQRVIEISRGFLALLIVIAVATILITPDTTDDVNGLLRSHQTLKWPSLSASVGISLVLFSLAASADSSSPVPTTFDLLRLICTYRC